MTYDELKRRLLTALDHPTTGNRLVATLALEDFSDSKDERIEALEAVLHKLATAPWVPQRVCDMAREALAMDGDEYIARLDAGREWPMATNE